MGTAHFFKCLRLKHAATHQFSVRAGETRLNKFEEGALHVEISDTDASLACQPE